MIARRRTSGYGMNHKSGSSGFGLRFPYGFFESSFRPG